MRHRINENGRFKKPKDGDSKASWDKYDNDLFQTGRLITCGLYVNCVLKDYVRTILNLNRSATKWDLDPRTTEGTGNQVSAEFNLSKYSREDHLASLISNFSLSMALGHFSKR